MSSKQRSIQALEAELDERKARLDDLSSQLGTATGDRAALQLQVGTY